MEVQRGKNRVLAAAMLIILAVIAVSFALQVKELSINPSNIMQAGSARFYENFIYNSSSYIPSNCVVYTYDPTLFNVIGKPALQYSYLYNASFYENVSRNYSCSIIDYGYWCTTPGNICSNAFTLYKTKPIVTAVYKPMDLTYGLYLITGKNES
ncbi:hypothetical protein M1373_01520 [Candidatus Marsarchaeota archaeon]|nr:hypothetical protein [Candidatus Marsarchaeota archaeon]MCL5404978.1 hypothetical protein [Candidatus Marsarchaeota archaeon]